MVMQQARHLQPRVQLAPDQAQGVQELDEPLERQVLGLDRDYDAIGGDQGVDRDGAERGRAVEEGAGEALAHRAEAFAQADLGVLDPGQLDRGARQVDVGGDDPEVVGTGGAGGGGDLGVAGQAVVGGRVQIAVAAEGDGRVALGVEVDEQGLLAFRRRCTRPG